MKSARKRSYRMVARARSADATRRRIIGAATQLFSQRPFDLVSLADVAAAAGLALATVVRQFATKEGLFAAALAEAGRAMAATIDETPVDDPPGVARHCVASYERFGDGIVRLLAQEDRVRGVREWTEHGRSEHARWIARAFSGVLDRLDPPRRKVRRAQLMAVTDVLFWKVLRRDLGLGRGATEQAIAEIVGQLCRQE